MMESGDRLKKPSISYSLVQNLRQQLMRILPFSQMAEEDVDFFYVEAFSNNQAVPNFYFWGKN